jgi:hypothetical protein
MSKEIQYSQRIIIWNNILNTLEVELKYDLEETVGICYHLTKELMAQGIYDSFKQANIDLPRLFPEFEKHRPKDKQWFNMWWKNDNIAKRINVVKEIINELESQPCTTKD